MKKFIVLFLFSLFSIILNAQIFKTPSVSVKNLSKGEQAVKLKSIDIDVKVMSIQASTSVDMTFYNPNSRVLEGELQFPLADGQTICGFALDINGKLRDGVAVEKDKARNAFESIVRRGVDPGLLEMTEGNNFKARIYPIFARNTRRAVITYENQLVKDEDGVYTYKLPLNYDTELEKVKIRVSAFAQNSVPKLTYGDKMLEVKENGDKYEVELQLKDTKPTDDLIIKFPEPNDKQLYVEYGKYDSIFKFYTSVQIPDVKLPAKSPASVAIFWDASLSMLEKDIEKEYAFLDAYFKTHQNIKVQLYKFDVKVNQLVTFNVSAANWGELKTSLQNITYDGATRYDSLDLKIAQCEQILLFSDGLSNIGQNTIPKSLVPVTVINSKYSANHLILKNIALSSGGLYINLSEQTSQSAIEQLKTNRYNYISADYKKREIEDLLIINPLDINKDGVLKISGKLKKRKASIKLNFGVGSEVLYTHTVELNTAQRNNYNNFVERLWAHAQINELNLDFEKNKTLISNLGKKYNLISPSTSLIVLETVEDYVRYDIIPPDELRERFDMLKEKFDRETKNDATDKAYEKKVKRRHKLWKASADIQDFTEILEKEELEKEKREEREDRRDNRRRERENKQYERQRKRRIKKYGYDTNTRYSGGSGTYKQSGDLWKYSSSTTITGKIREVGTNGPLPFVTVAVKGTNIGVMADIDGNYSINVPSGTTRLEFHFVGFTSISVPIERHVIDVEMGYEYNYLEDVVIVGFGTKRSDNDNVKETSATEKINSGSSALPTNTGNAGEESETSTIRFMKLKSDTMYIGLLKGITPENLYQTYLANRSKYINVPEYYIDVADELYKNNFKHKAYKVLSNIAEIDFDNPKLLRNLARRLEYWGYLEDAIRLYEKVVHLRPEQPQTFRDLGLAYAKAKQYQKAIDMLDYVVENKFDNRFEPIKAVVIGEMGNIIGKAKSEKIKITSNTVSKGYLKNAHADIRVVVNWDTDNTNLDLKIEDPTGMQRSSNYEVSEIGGIFSDDMSGGYGPEEFMLRNAVEGTYSINFYFYSREQSITGPTTAYIDIYTNYGRANEKREMIAVRIEGKHVRSMDAAKFVFKK